MESTRPDPLDRDSCVPCCSHAHNQRFVIVPNLPWTLRLQPFSERMTMFCDPVRPAGMGMGWDSPGDLLIGGMCLCDDIIRGSVMPPEQKKKTGFASHHPVEVNWMPTFMRQCRSNVAATGDEKKSL